MDRINKTCGEIQTDGGFQYRLQADLLNQTSDLDCEQSCYLPVSDGRLIADPSNPHKLIDPVISVSSDRLFTSYCMDELHHEIQCHFKRIIRETMFRAFNDSIDGSTQTPESHQFWWFLALLFFIVLLLLICFMLRKRIFSCILRAVTKIFRSNDSEIRDPEAAVQMISFS
ncbi:hypothetical protein G5714_004039 [Onychostoma macrolepis]|uniref:Uncharacterized protein n=1 Tax=Onychostoma macrolepis TaxID=369639 RepID=A0A7J6DBC5_9TELE|nr:hypothetical protein G5714_004039 [Onychostoma macrolepis]